MKLITQELVDKIRHLLSFGLTKGLGQPKEGEMCVEAAICYALGENHSDKPSCVPAWLSELKIKLNDHPKHKDNQARAKCLERLAIAQLGSLHLVREDFIDLLWIKTHQRILPKIIKDKEWSDRFSQIKSKEEFEKLWKEFESSEDYHYYHYYYHYHYHYYHYEGILQDIADIMVECCIEFKTEGSKYL